MTHRREFLRFIAGSPVLAAIGLAAFTVLFIILPSGLFDNFGSPESAFAARLRMGGSWQSVIFGGAVLVGVTLIATWALYHGLRKLEPNLDANAIAEAHFLDTLESGKVDLAIAISAALSLFLELALIRWQSSVLEFLAFYKNFSLLACFAGLGLGYALAARTLQFKGGQTSGRA